MKFKVRNQDSRIYNIRDSSEPMLSNYRLQYNHIFIVPDYLIIIYHQ